MIYIAISVIPAHAYFLLGQASVGIQGYQAFTGPPFSQRMTYKLTKNGCFNKLLILSCSN